MSQRAMCRAMLQGVAFSRRPPVVSRGCWPAAHEGPALRRRKAAGHVLSAHASLSCTPPETPFADDAAWQRRRAAAPPLRAPAARPQRQRGRRERRRRQVGAPQRQHARLQLPCHPLPAHRHLGTAEQRQPGQQRQRMPRDGLRRAGGRRHRPIRRHQRHASCCRRRRPCGSPGLRAAGGQRRGAACGGALAGAAAGHHVGHAAGVRRAAAAAAGRRACSAPAATSLPAAIHQALPARQVCELRDLGGEGGGPAPACCLCVRVAPWLVRCSGTNPSLPGPPSLQPAPACHHV